MLSKAVLQPAKAAAMCIDLDTTYENTFVGAILGLTNLSQLVCHVRQTVMHVHYKR